MQKLFLIFLTLTFLYSDANAKLVGITSDYRRNTDGKNDFAKTSFYALRDNYVSSLQKICKKYDVTVVIVPLDKSMIDAYSKSFDGLVFSGNYYDVNPKLYGEKILNDSVKIDDYKNDFESALFKKFYQTKKPIFGICGGYHMINVALKGKLYQDIPTQVKTNINHSFDGNKCGHDLEILAGNNIFATALANSKQNENKLCVNSTHHQAISQISSQLNVTAVASDGIIEGFEAKNHPFLIGVQWHPEYQLTKFDTALIEEFCKAIK